MAKPKKKASAAKTKKAKQRPAKKKPIAAKPKPKQKAKPAPKKPPPAPSGGMTIRLKKVDMDAELEAELAQIFETDTRTAMKPVPVGAHILTPAEADKLAGGKWFTGYTNAVQLVEGPATVTSFDEASRGGDAEYLIFEQGLTVTGTFDLSRIYRSIIVVRGTLKARRIVLGDAVLVVEKAVQASELVFGPMSEGIFSLAGMQIESDPEDLATAISAPIVALYDRDQREWVVRKNGVPAELAPELVEDASALAKRLLAGKSIF